MQQCKICLGLQDNTNCAAVSAVTASARQAAGGLLSDAELDALCGDLGAGGQEVIGKDAFAAAFASASKGLSDTAFTSLLNDLML